MIGNESLNRIASEYLSARAGATGPDGTSAYNSPDTLLLAGLTHAPRNFEFLEVIEHRADGSERRYKSSRYQMAYVNASGILTVGLTTNGVREVTFVATSTFTVIYSRLTDPTVSPWASMLALMQSRTGEHNVVPTAQKGIRTLARVYTDAALPALTAGRDALLSLTENGLLRVWGAVEAVSGIVTAVAPGALRMPTMTEDRTARTQDLRMLLALVGRDAVYCSPDDFVATRTAPTTLAITGLPVVPASSQFLGVIQYVAASGLSIFHTVREGFTFAFAPTGPGAGTLTVTGTGVAFGAGDQFTVVILNKKKAYDAVLNALQIVQMNSVVWDFIDSDTPITAHNLAGGVADTGWIVTKGETSMRLLYDWTSGAGVGIHNLLVTMVGESTDGGTTEFLELAGPEGVMVSGAAVANTRRSEIVDVTAYDRVKIYVDESGGTGKGTLVALRYTMMNAPTVPSSRVARVYVGTPDAKTLGQIMTLAINQAGSLYAHLTQAITRTSQITGFEAPPDGIILPVLIDCAAVGTAYPIVAASTPCIGVFLCAAAGNGGECRVGNSTIAAVGAFPGVYIPISDVSAPIFVPVTNANLLYVAGNNNGDDVYVMILTRA